MRSYIAQDILEMFNSENLANTLYTQQVSDLWMDVVKNGQLWKKMFDRHVRIIYYSINPFIPHSTHSFYILYQSGAEWFILGENGTDPGDSETHQPH